LHKNRFCAQVLAYGLKGNRVQIPDSPAAVMLRELSEKAPSPLATCLSWPGRFQKGGESEDLPFVKELFLLVG